LPEVPSCRRKDYSSDEEEEGEEELDNQNEFDDIPLSVLNLPNVLTESKNVLFRI
jgi:hypothetical protein